MTTDSVPSDVQGTTPAGWFPDPNGGTGQRWWDGAAWTDRTQLAPTGPICPVCGHAGARLPREKAITQKQRYKFGLLWLIISICTSGIGLIIWLILPRRNVTVSVDRWLECPRCHART